MTFDSRSIYAGPYIAPGGELSPREIQILRLAAMGTSNKDIAQRYGIAHQTVKNHLNNVYIKLRVHNKTEAVMNAIGAGYFSAEDVCV